MSNIKIENEGEIYDMDDLSGDQLIVLAMCAFLYMKKEKKLDDAELLESILQWFELMTADVVEFRPLSDEDLNDMIPTPDQKDMH